MLSLKLLIFKEVFLYPIDEINNESLVPYCSFINSKRPSMSVIIPLLFEKYTVANGIEDKVRESNTLTVED
jgi:hypothetical protein